MGMGRLAGEEGTLDAGLGKCGLCDRKGYLLEKGPAPFIKKYGLIEKVRS